MPIFFDCKLLTLYKLPMALYIEKFRKFMYKMDFLSI